MNTQHTPGPYSISGIIGDNHIMARVKHERRTVAIAVGWPGLTPEEFEANKRLLQTAPKLLAALQEALPELRESLEAIGGCDHSVGICCCPLLRAIEHATEAINEVKGIP